MADSDSDRWLTPDPETSSLGETGRKLRSSLGRLVDDARARGEEYLNSTRTGLRSGVGDSRSGVEQIEPPRDAYAKYRQQHDTTPLLAAPIDQAEADILADGWRVEADDERTQQFLDEWFSQCAIVAGAPGKDLGELLSLWVKCWYIYGMPLIEHVPAKERPDAIAALKMIPPSTISFHTRPGSSMLLQPDDDDLAGKLTESGDAAAYSQYDRHADETWTDGSGQPLAERRLSFDDVSKDVRAPDVGDVTGTSAIEAVSEQVETLKETFRNDAKAIESQAWGQWFAGFEPIVHDTAEGTEIIEFEDDAQQDFREKIERVEPGGIVTHDGKINVQNLPGEVADVVGRYTFFVNYISAAMPAPKFTTGFADDMNRDIAEDQAQQYEQGEVDSVQETIRTTFTKIAERVAEQHAYPTEGIALKLEAPADDSPILSLDDSDIQNIKTYMQAADLAAGDGPASTVVDEEVLLDLILQLPEDAGVPSTARAGVDEADPEAQEQFNRLQDSLGVQPEQ